MTSTKTTTTAATSPAAATTAGRGQARKNPPAATTPEASTPAPPVGQMRYLDPTVLVMFENVRLDPRLDAEFLASVALHGVLQPIVATQEHGETVTVRHGHRRTLAALQAHLPTVPVYVIPADTGDGAKRDRIIEQLAENEHRTGLGEWESADAIHQLSLLGMSAAQVAKQTGHTRTRVGQVAAVKASPLADKALQRYDFMTLDVAVLVAEFAVEKDVVTAIITAARSGRDPEHVAQRARDDGAREQGYLAAVALLTEVGVRVIDEPRDRDRTVRRLREMGCP